MPFVGWREQYGMYIILALLCIMTTKDYNILHLKDND